MLLHPRHGWHLRGVGSGGPAPGEANLNTVLAACALAMFATNLDFFALNLSIPGMARDLDVSTTDMQWAISGYHARPRRLPDPGRAARRPGRPAHGC